MKIALCFIINYDHILNKEHIWREWIEPNKDIINVYFFYKDIKKIKSKWILDNALPINYVCETSYYHVIPAYIALLNYALYKDPLNKWFCMLTDTCCPIISPAKFRYLFFNNSNHSIFSWKRAWWNPTYHKRANLIKLIRDFWLANDPWFILTRENVLHVLEFVGKQTKLTQTICNGGLANESLFAIIFKFYGELDNKQKKSITNASSHIVDWNRMTSSTSPHIFKEGNEVDITFIGKELERNEYACFIRKVSPEFPDTILKHFIYKYNKKEYLYEMNNNTNYLFLGYLNYIILCFPLFFIFFTLLLF